MDTKKILVTGGLGYIGSHTVVELIQNGYEVTIMDNLSNSDIRVLDWISQIVGVTPELYQMDCCDLGDLMYLFKSHKFHGVIHFAAKKSVIESVEDPLEYYSNNLISTVNLINCMRYFNVPNLIFSSSCTVYGQPRSIPVTEEYPILPAESPYGRTKQMCEDIISDSVEAYGNISALMLRYFNPIGAHPSGLIGELPKGTPQNLIPYLTQVAIGKRDTLNIFGNDYDTFDGTCIRDYIDVCDLAKAHVKALKYLESNDHGLVDVFNIGTGNWMTTKQIVEKFIEVNDIDLNYRYVDRRPGDIEKIYASVNKANSILNWKAEVPIEETLRSAWKWQLRLSELGM